MYNTQMYHRCCNCLLCQVGSRIHCNIHVSLSAVPRGNSVRFKWKSCYTNLLLLYHLLIFLRKFELRKSGSGTKSHVDCFLGQLILITLPKRAGMFHTYVCYTYIIIQAFSLFLLGEMRAAVYSKSKQVPQ